jgi:hypothetical protein
MRQAFGAFKASSAAMRAAAIALAATQAVACAAIERAVDPVLTNTHADELRVAAAEKSQLETRVAALSTENETLKSQVAELEKKLSQTQRAVALRDAQIAALPKPGTPKAELKPAITATKPASTAPADPVVAAANADAALPEARAAVDAAPRLVQPTFSSAETTFENEAQGDIKVASILWGVHLASYRRAEEASAGWRKLQRDYPDELGLLEPRIERISITGKGIFLRLVGGGFSSRDKADALCASLSSKGVFCRVANFGGDRLSMADEAS